jgi:hypothetical protein
LRGALPGWTEVGRAFGLGPNRKDRFFSNFFNAKTIPEKFRNCLKARKILRKSKKFLENSQRIIGTWTIQIKYLELMKKILEPSNK